MVVDGGTKASGEQLIEHIQTVFGTNIVQHAVNTHPDCDHSSSLTVVLEKLQVQNLWTHQPWNYAGHIRDLFRDGRITDQSLEQHIREA